MLNDESAIEQYKLRLNLMNNSSQIDLDISRPSITSMNRKENEMYNTFSSIKPGNQEYGDVEAETPKIGWGPPLSSYISS